MTISNRQARFLRQAAAIARSVHNGSPWYFGGLLVRKGRVISTGTNHPFKTHRRSNTYYRNIHCELDCILGIDKEKVEGATLYVVRVGFDDRASLMPSRPCEHCEEILRKMLIRDIYFTVDNNTIGYWNLAQNKEVWIRKDAA